VDYPAYLKYFLTLRNTRLNELYTLKHKYQVIMWIFVGNKGIGPNFKQHFDHRQVAGKSSAQQGSIECLHFTNYLYLRLHRPLMNIDPVDSAI